MRNFIFSILVLLSSSASASSSLECWERLAASFETVTAERWPEVLKEFFGSELLPGRSETLKWQGTLSVSWDHPSRGAEVKTEETASVQAVLYNQIEIDKSSTVGIDMTAVRAYGRYRLEIDNSRESGFNTENLSILYSPSAKILIFVRKNPARNQIQTTHFLKTNTEQMMAIFEEVITTLPDGSEYKEKATLKVAR